MCHTDLVTCCSCGQSIPRGTGIPQTELDCHSLVMITKLVRLMVLRESVHGQTTHRRPAGIYRCDIPTIAVYDNTDIQTLVNHSYVNLSAVGSASDNE